MVKNRVKTTCIVCKKEFETVPSVIAKGMGKFCSRVCMGFYRKTKYQSNGNPAWKGMSKECPICHQAFHIRPSENDNRTTCSKKCYAIYKKQFHIGKNHPRWTGGLIPVKNSGKTYVGIYMPDHPRAHNGYVKEHILVAEKALGKPLPPNAIVHHINKDSLDNRPCNLVICENNSYHSLIHSRQRRIQCQN